MGAPTLAAKIDPEQTVSFTLGENVDVEKVSATFEHGMLELVLPMAEAAKPHRIEISGVQVAPKIEKKVA